MKFQHNSDANRAYNPVAPLDVTRSPELCKDVYGNFILLRPDVISAVISDVSLF
jgi:hypothetical protein